VSSPCGIYLSYDSSSDIVIINLIFLGIDLLFIRPTCY
jgi:hypothetical protein